MKTTILFLLCALSGLTVMSKQQVTEQLLDQNGNVVHGYITAEAPFNHTSEIAAFAYDSVRDLAEINHPSFPDAFPWISSDGLRLYYSGGINGSELQFTQRADLNSFFDPPVTISIPVVNTTTDPVSYWLSADELDIYCCKSTSVYYAHRTSVSSAFNTAIIISLSGISFSYIKSASLNALQDRLILWDSNNGIMEFQRTSATSFSYLQNLPLPSGYVLSTGQMSKDELTYFCTGEIAGGHNMIYSMTRTSSTSAFDVSTFQQVIGINDPLSWNTQPSMSDSLKVIAFVRSDLNSWSSNELYIAYGDHVTSVFDAVKNSEAFIIYPNPSNGYIHLKTGESQIRNFEVIDLLGKKIKEISPGNTETIELDLTNEPHGIYFLKAIYTSGQIKISKLVIN